MTRDQINALLPFYANGTLEGEDRAAVEAALAEDETLRRELQALQAIRATMQAEEDFSPGEMGLARIMRSVEAEAAPVPAATRPWLWQAAAAVLLAVVLGQAALQDRSPDPGGYQLAGDAEPAFVIAVAPDVGEAELRALLLEAGVIIVNGPSALGLYDLALAEGVTEADARAALDGSALLESVQAADD